MSPTRAQPHSGVSNGLEDPGTPPCAGLPGSSFRGLESNQRTSHQRTHTNVEVKRRNPFEPRLPSSTSLTGPAAGGEGLRAPPPGLKPGGARNEADGYFLTEAAATKGARCLDGTPGLYYHRKGAGAGANKWLVHHQVGPRAPRRSCPVIEWIFRLLYPSAPPVVYPRTGPLTPRIVRATWSSLQGGGWCQSLNCTEEPCPGDSCYVRAGMAARLHTSGIQRRPKRLHHICGHRRACERRGLDLRGRAPSSGARGESTPRRAHSLAARVNPHPDEAAPLAH